MKAFCYRSGQIVFATRMPAGTLPIACGPDRQLRRVVTSLAEKRYDETFLFIRGVERAANASAALSALIRFKGAVEWRLGHRAKGVKLSRAFVRPAVLVDSQRRRANGS